MRVIEDMTKAIMADSCMEIESWPLAVNHAVWLLNLMPMSRKISSDGTGPRPLQELSNWLVSTEECDKRLEASQPPGRLCYVSIPKAPRGSNVQQLHRYRWGRTKHMEGRTMVFQDP